MVVLSSIAGAAVLVAKQTVIYAFIYALWRDIASPLTVWLLAWAGLGVMYDHLVVPDRNVEMREGLAIGGVSAVLVGVSGTSLPNFGGR